MVRYLSGNDFIQKWERENLPGLAANIAIRRSTPEKDYGPEFDPWRIPEVFNPYGLELCQYLDIHYNERVWLFERLKQMVADYTREHDIKPFDI